MDTFGQILSDMHLYKGKIEYLIKLIIWLLSWTIGIIVARYQGNNIGSAYFIFSLALLMEFSSQIIDKKEYISRILHTIFCIMMVLVIVFSILSILLTDHKIYDCILYVLSWCIMVYMILDCIILWVSKDKEDETVNNEKDEDKQIKFMMDKFNENLKGGNLGKIKKR